MKKPIITTIILLVLCFDIAAQTITVTTAVNDPGTLVTRGDYVYIVDTGGGKISKVNHTLPSPSIENVVTGLTNPIDIAFRGNEMYIFQCMGTLFNDGKISKVDLSATTINVIDVITGFINCKGGMAIRANELFFSDPNSNTISKINLDISNPSVDIVVSNLDVPVGLAFKANYLYIAERSTTITGEISKIDVTQATPIPTTVITGQINPNYLTFNGNDLYFSDFTEDKIFKVATNAVSPSIDEIVANLDLPLGVAFVNGTDLYISELDANRVSKIVLGYLSNPIVLAKKVASIYPNPAAEFIVVTGIEKLENYKIYNVLGACVNTGSVLNEKKINIQNLDSGVYYIKIGNGETKKIIKQ